MKILKLTMACDNTLVLVNPLQIKVVYKGFGGRGAIVRYSGLEDEYIEVKETVETIEKMLEKFEMM